MANDMWKIFSAAFIGTMPTDDEFESIKNSGYIFRNWISADPELIQVANYLNFFHDIPIKNQFQLIRGRFGGKKRYIKYVKPAKYDAELIDILKIKYKCDRDKALEYADLIPEDQLKKIKKEYTRHLKAKQNADRRP